MDNSTVRAIHSVEYARLGIVVKGDRTRHTERAVPPPQRVGIASLVLETRPHPSPMEVALRVFIVETFGRTGGQTRFGWIHQHSIERLSHKRLSIKWLQSVL